MDAKEKVLPFMPQFINPELHAIFNDKDDQDGGSNQSVLQSVTDMLVAEASSLQSKFVKNFKSKVFKRFFLENGPTASKYKQKSSSTKDIVSLQDIIMESWTGSRVYKLTHEGSQKSNKDKSSGTKLGISFAEI